MSKRTLTLISIFCVLLIVLFLYLFFFEKEFLENTNNSSNVNQEQVENNTDFNQNNESPNNDEDFNTTEPADEGSVDKNPDTEQPDEEVIQYKYMYEVESVQYEPDPGNYGGFKICDLENSTCTVYGVEYKHIAKAVLGGKYILSFNQLGDCKPALGTAYCLVEGELGEVQVEQVEPY